MAVDTEAFQRLLDIELGMSVDVAAGGAAGRDTHVTIRCVPDGVELHLRDAITRKTMTRVLSSASLEADSARLLALAVAEFVVASWIELAVAPEPPVPPIGAAPPAASLGVARRVAKHKVKQGGVGSLRLGVALSVTSWLAEQRPMVLGPGIRLAQRVAAPVFWEIGADFSIGSTTLEQGRVDFGGTTFFGLLGLSGLADFWEAGFGAGLRGGYLRTAGVPERGKPFDGALRNGPVGGPFILTSVIANLGEVARLGLELEAGYPLWSVRMTSGREVVLGFDGPWLRGGLMVGVEF